MSDIEAAEVSLADARRLGREWLAVGGVPRALVPLMAALTAPEPPSYPGLRLDEYVSQAQAWLNGHLPHYLTESECVPCQMATNLVLVCNAWFEVEGWHADEKAEADRGPAPVAASGETPA